MKDFFYLVVALILMALVSENHGNRLRARFDCWTGVREACAVVSTEYAK